MTSQAKEKYRCAWCGRGLNRMEHFYINPILRIKTCIVTYRCIYDKLNFPELKEKFDFEIVRGGA